MVFSYFLFILNSQNKPILLFFRQLDHKVETLMRERKDYQAYVMRPVSSDYYNYAKQFHDEVPLQVGEIDAGV